jgi:hypothetical protein
MSTPTLATAHRRGVTDALARFKVAGPMGAEYGVGPPGSEVSHGTMLLPNQPRSSSNSVPGGAYDPATRLRAEGSTDALFNISEYDRQAPGNVSGYGQEVIG